MFVTPMILLGNENYGYVGRFVFTSVRRKKNSDISFGLH